jgi:hypothetical protein
MLRIFKFDAASHNVFFWGGGGGHNAIQGNVHFGVWYTVKKVTDFPVPPSPKNAYYIKKFFSPIH